MNKYPRTKDGMAKRRNAAIVGLNKQFNPANGEVSREGTRRGPSPQALKYGLMVM
jgi:hypothetical protein